MSFNLWFDEHEMEARMAGIDELIQRHRPHLVALQEVANLPGSHLDRGTVKVRHKTRVLK